MALLVISFTNLIILIQLPFYKKFNFLTHLSGRENPETTLIVLGAGVWRNEPSGMLKCRINKAIDLYARDRAHKMLLSGDGTDNHYRETNAMREYASLNGVRVEDIMTDPLGFSTYDSLRRAAEVFNIRNAIVVSQGFHLSRAVWLAKSFSIDAMGIPCDTETSTFYYHLREIPARSKDTLLRWFNSPSRKNRDEIF
jgi:vancomycin permeability regulator SanA